MTDSARPDQPMLIEAGRRSPYLTVILDSADFRRLAIEQAPWKGVAHANHRRVSPVGRHSLSDRYLTWPYVYRFGDSWTGVVMARTYLDAINVQYEIVFDSTPASFGYAILTDYDDPSCGTCPFTGKLGASEDPPEQFRCHGEPETCAAVFRRHRRVVAASVLDDDWTADQARDDGTPESNVMIEFIPAGTKLWWRLPDDSWTDGDRVGTWTDIQRDSRGFTAIRPITRPSAVLHTAVVQRDAMAQALLAHDLERWYIGNGWPDARSKALKLLDRLTPDSEPSDTTTAVADALMMSHQDVLTALAVPSREPASRHLWEIEHPFYGALVADDHTECASFHELTTYLNRHDNDGSTVIYRWDWVDSSSHLLDGADAEDPGPDEFRIHGLLPRTSRLFTLSCPITKDEEPDVLSWLRGPRMLGALKHLWEPLFDEPAATDHSE